MSFDDLGPLPKINPRADLQTKARLRLYDYLIEVQHDLGLTDAEVVYALQESQTFLLTRIVWKEQKR